MNVNKYLCRSNTKTMKSIVISIFFIYFILQSGLEILN